MRVRPRASDGASVSTNQLFRKISPSDFIVENHGSIFLLRPVSAAASDWVSEHIPEDAQWFGDAVAVEHRYIGDIVRGIQNDGFMVS